MYIGMAVDLHVVREVVNMCVPCNHVAYLCMFLRKEKSQS